MRNNVKPEHRWWLSRLGDDYLDTEYYLSRPSDHGGAFLWGDKFLRAHGVAVVVLKDGSVYTGEAKCTTEDTWSRKVGYTMAVGRALKAAALRTPKWCVGKVEAHLRGVELRDACRERLVMLKRLDEGRLRDPLARVVRDL